MLNFTPPTPGANKWPFKLGDIVRDRLTGLEGVAVGRYFHLSGCDQFAIQPPAKDGVVPEYVSFDANRIELVEAKNANIDEIPGSEICLGDNIRCRVTGIEGTASIIFVPYSGAHRVCVDPGWDSEKGKMRESFWVDEQLLEVVKPLKVENEKPMKRPGAMRMPHAKP